MGKHKSRSLTTNDYNNCCKINVIRIDISHITAGVFTIRPYDALCHTDLPISGIKVSVVSMSPGSNALVITKTDGEIIVYNFVCQI